MTGAKPKVDRSDEADGKSADTASAFGSAEDELRILYAALDNVDSGLLILDKDFRAIYSNRVLHERFGSWSAERIRSEHPTYEELVRDSSRVAAVDMDDYVARRVAWVRSGKEPPMDLRLNKGMVLRSHVTTLPDGGRMLIYSDITDLVRATDELERLATIDGMTGIFNRRHFFALAERECERARRYRYPVALMMIDIDHFKQINDTHGHSVGDEVIVAFAGMAMECKRDADVLARIGGEEFVLLLPHTDEEQAKVVAERIRRKAELSMFSSGGLEIATTVSIGVAGCSTAMVDITELMRAADQRLYEAKRSGRNRVV